MEDGEPNLMSALEWKYGLTPTLRGRDVELEAILGWAEGSGSTVSVRLVSGPGGAGKTRLAAETARRLRERGWSAGFLPRDAQSGQVVDASGRAAGGGLMLILDYPEERLEVMEALFEHVADLANPPLPICFLLVSRQGFEDWRRRAGVLGGRFGRQELAAAGPLAPEDALATLSEAAEAFAGLTESRVPPLDAAPAWLEADPARRLPLSAMAAGVHAVLAGRGDFALGAPELMRELAWREHARVRRVSKATGLGERGLERLLALALTTPGGLDAAALERLGALGAAPGLAGQALLDAVKETPWWERAPTGGRRLARIEPDRPAAAFLELALLEDPSPRLPDWLHATTVEAGAEFGRILSRLVWDLLSVSVEGRGAAALERAALAMLDATPERVHAFEAVGSEQGTTFSAGFAAKVLEHLLPEAEGPKQRAGLLNNLANFLLDLGRRKDALAAVEEAVGLYRHLAAAQPEAFTPSLAMALSTLASVLSHLGRLEEALAAADEAGGFYRHLAAAHPEAFAPDLAMSLNNFSKTLLDLGRREDSLSAAEEGVALYHRLAAARPHDFTPDLVTAINNFGNTLSSLGRREEALAAAKEVVVLRRRLAAARPDAFTPHLATALDNLGIRLSHLGRHEEALTAAGEAADLLRRLAAARPDAFTPVLAISLINLGNRLSALGRREEALAATREAVALYRRLAAAQPDASTPGLAKSLTSLGNCLSALGRHEEALAAAKEATELSRRLAAARSDAFTPDLAMSLNNLGNRLSALGRHEEALAAAKEATELYRRLAAARSDAFTPNLAMSLNNLGNRLSALGRHEEALAAAKEATELYRRLAAARSDAFTPNLAMSLNNLGNRLSALGRHEEALAAAKEATELYRRLAAARSDAFTPNLAMSLNNLGNRLSALGRHEEALAAAEEAVRLLAPFFVRNPPAFAQWMQTMVNVYIEACETSNRTPSSEVLGPVVEVFERLKVGADKDRAASRN